MQRCKGLVVLVAVQQSFCRVLLSWLTLTMDCCRGYGSGQGGFNSYPNRGPPDRYAH